MVTVAGFTDTTILELNVEESDDVDLQVFLVSFQALLNTVIIPIYFVYVLLMAVIAKCVFRAEKYTVAEYYIPFLLNTFHISSVSIIPMLFGLYNEAWVQGILAVVSILYMTWGISNIFEPATIKKYCQCLIIALLGFVVFAMVFALLGFLGFSQH